MHGIKELITQLEQVECIKDDVDSYDHKTYGPNKLVIQLGYRLLGLCIYHGILPRKIGNLKYDGGIIFYFSRVDDLYFSIELLNDKDILTLAHFSKEVIQVKLCHFKDLSEFVSLIKRSLILYV